LISRKRVQLVHKRNEQWWVLVDGKRVGLIAKQHGTRDMPFLYRKLGFNTTPRPARTKNEAIDRLLASLEE
jgi:hypothetical protein